VAHLGSLCHLTGTRARSSSISTSRIYAPPTGPWCSSTSWARSPASSSMSACPRRTSQLSATASRCPRRHAPLPDLLALPRRAPRRSSPSLPTSSRPSHRASSRPRLRLLSPEHPRPRSVCTQPSRRHGHPMPPAMTPPSTCRPPGSRTPRQSGAPRVPYQMPRSTLSVSDPLAPQVNAAVPMAHTRHNNDKPTVFADTPSDVNSQSVPESASSSTPPQLFGNASFTGTAATTASASKGSLAPFDVCRRSEIRALYFARSSESQ
jgi:hypothetical protein